MINESQASKYCKEDISKIKNYDLAIADTTQVWDCHHMTETWWNCTAKELIENECYYNRKACELIFLTHSEHIRLHSKGENNPMYGRTGENHPMYGRTGENHPNFGKHLSQETRRKLSEARKGRTFTEEWRIKISEAHKGKKHSEEARRKMSEAAKRRWAKGGR